MPRQQDIFEKYFKVTGNLDLFSVTLDKLLKVKEQNFNILNL